jgi:ABC-type multidrug transport system fused ATPase/permease subunit
VLVQTSNREQSELDRFLDEQRVALTADLTATRVKATFAPMIDLTELAGALLVIGWGTWALARAASAWVGSSSS